MQQPSLEEAQVIADIVLRVVALTNPGATMPSPEVVRESLREAYASEGAREAWEAEEAREVELDEDGEMDRATAQAVYEQREAEEARLLTERAIKQREDEDARQELAREQLNQTFKPADSEANSRGTWDGDEKEG